MFWTLRRCQLYISQQLMPAADLDALIEPSYTPDFSQRPDASTILGRLSGAVRTAVAMHYSGATNLSVAAVLGVGQMQASRFINKGLGFLLKTFR
jgi:hypothetical protein